MNNMFFLALSVWDDTVTKLAVHEQGYGEMFKAEVHSSVYIPLFRAYVQIYVCGAGIFSYCLLYCFVYVGQQICDTS